MASRKQLAQEIIKVGGIWDTDYDTIDAPVGHVWSGTGSHEFVMARDYDGMKYSSSDFQEALEMVRAGVERCSTVNCDYCAENIRTPEGEHIMSEELVTTLRSVLGSKISFEPSTVIKFDSTSRVRGAEMDYNYAAIFAADHRWYLTGVNKHYGDRLTTSDFLEVLKHSDVKNVKLATAWGEI